MEYKTQIKVTTTVHGAEVWNVHSIKEAMKELPFLHSFAKPLVESAHNGNHFRITYEIGVVKMVIELC